MKRLLACLLLCSCSHVYDAGGRMMDASESAPFPLALVTLPVAAAGAAICVPVAAGALILEGKP